MKRAVLILCLLAPPALAQTAQEKSALDWCVREGATKWLANARSVLGTNAEGAIAAKIAKCLPLYLAASDKRPLAERQN
jgi:hypothetical protein